ncbi:MAG: LLM class flavin-dependent oxidoreductase [Gammaproteobacteria bacterium]|nr:LLM class flavin-dependent oxidoreductase [Gammaproteobacteria bacterium]MCY4343171.1 LLM class flavin-dependent oxidoreductase [Gammaproteobacteria bacterium]
MGPVTGESAPNRLAEQARTYAGEGFDSLWSAHALGRGFMLTEPFIALSVAATAAEGVEIGTAVLQAPLYHPVELALRIFSLHQICGDRLVIGLGAGSTQSDFAVLGRPYETRFSDARSVIEALRGIFSTGQHEGKDVAPWPDVRGGPPLVLGSWGQGVERAAAEFDGWIASAHYRSADQVVAALGRYRQAGGGRAVVSTIQLPPGTDLGELKAKLDRFAEAGFDDAVVMILPGGPSPESVRQLVD